MKAKLLRQGDVTVVQVTGKLDLERNQAFREICSRELQGHKVVFCLDELQFVGSSGIQYFFRTLDEVHQSNPYGVKISGVNADFFRLLQHTVVSGLEIHEDLSGALNSFMTGIPGGIQLSAPAPLVEAEEAASDFPELLDSDSDRIS